MGQYSLLLIILGISIPIVAVQYLLYRFTKIRFLIYALPIIIFLATLYFVFYAYFVPLEGFASLGYFVMALMSGGIFIISLVAALIFDFMKRRRVKS